MADYGIYEVRFDDDHSEIKEVHAYKIENNNTKESNSFSRSEVISKIELNYKFATLIKGSNGNWSIGSNVLVYTIDNKKFIKTKSNNTGEDNLGELPQY